MDMKDGWSTQAAHLPLRKSEGESAREGALLWPDSSFSWGQVLIHRLVGGGAALLKPHLPHLPPQPLPP